MQSVEHWATGMFLPDDSAAMQQAKRQWVRLIQSDAYLAGWRAGVEAAAVKCEMVSENAKPLNPDDKGYEWDQGYVGGAADCADYIRNIPPPGCGKGGEG